MRPLFRKNWGSIGFLVIRKGDSPSEMPRLHSLQQPIQAPPAGWWDGRVLNLFLSDEVVGQAVWTPRSNRDGERSTAWSVNSEKFDIAHVSSWQMIPIWVFAHAVCDIEVPPPELWRLSELPGQEFSLCLCGKDGVGRPQGATGMIRLVQGIRTKRGDVSKWHRHNMSQPTLKCRKMM